MTAVARANSAKPVIGAGLLHPVALGAIAVLLINDHVLKATYPGFLTGKLSDFAGLIFFPVFLVAAYELAASLTGRQARTDRVPLLVAAAASGVVFSAIKISPEINGFIGQILGVAQWSITTLLSVVTNAYVPPPSATSIVMDVTDLIALPMLLVALWVGRDRISFG